MTRSSCVDRVAINSYDLVVLRRVGCLLVLALVCACGSSEQVGTAQAAADSTVTVVRATIAAASKRERQFDAVMWEPVWSRGGAREEMLIAVVRSLIPHANGVLLADEGALQLTSFDGSSGATRWSLGRKGAGPGEFQAMTDVTLDGRGNTLVLDAATSRITTISPTGELQPYRNAGPLAMAEQICAMPDGTVATVLRRPDMWVAMVRDSAVHKAFTFPVALPSGAPRMVTSVSFAHGEADGPCTLFTTFGYGIGALYGDSASLVLHPYAEALSQPTFDVTEDRSGPAVRTTTIMTSGTSAATRGSRWRDTVVLNFSGASGPGKPVLDVYTAQGRYLHSWRYPHTTIERAAYANGTLYTLSNSMIAPQLTAWRRVQTAGQP